MASAQDSQAEWSVVQSYSQVYCLRQLAEVRQRYSFGVTLACRAATPFLAFVVHGLITGVLFIAVTGYPYFLFFTFENRQKLPTA